MHENNVASMVFTPVKPLPEILGQPRARKEILQQIKQDNETFLKFHMLTSQEQEALLEFCMGNRSLKITYDPFFQSIFHPSNHPNRLSRLLSNILNQPVIIRDILPREGVRLAAEASLMVMDILVELANGSLINVEMQKIGYNFPIARSFCYGADLLVRQYDRTKAALGKKFTYKDMRPVYIIVLMENSSALFKKDTNTYIHHSTFQLSSGLPIENLLNFIYIPLDIFLDMPHNEITELDAWLYFLSSDNPSHIMTITEKYPFFKELYKDIITLRYNPKELITMYSETLLVADRNTVTLMIDEMRQEYNELSEETNALRQEYDALTQTNNTLSQQNDSLSQQNDALAQQNVDLKQELEDMRAEKDAEIARLKAALAEKS